MKAPKTIRAYDLERGRTVRLRVDQINLDLPPRGAMRGVKTVAIYAHADDTPPLDQQLRLMRRYARRHRWQVVREFIETRETGLNALKALIASVEAHEHNSYVYWHDILNRPAIGPVISASQDCGRCARWDACQTAEMKRRLHELRTI